MSDAVKPTVSSLARFSLSLSFSVDTIGTRQRWVLFDFILRAAFNPCAVYFAFSREEEVGIKLNFDSF